MAFPVLLDAATLIPINLADLLLRLADAYLYRPLWSATILEEVERNLPRVRSTMTPEKARIRVNQMRKIFPDAQVREYEPLIPRMTNDPKDRHVLAAAVRAEAAQIVTFNLRDFPVYALAPHDIDAVHPDQFLLDQLDLYPEQTLRCLHELVIDRRRPPETLLQVLGYLRKQTPQFCDEVLRRLA